MVYSVHDNLYRFETLLDPVLLAQGGKTGNHLRGGYKGGGKTWEEIVNYGKEDGPPSTKNRQKYRHGGSDTKVEKEAPGWWKNRPGWMGGEGGDININTGDLDGNFDPQLDKKLDFLREMEKSKEEVGTRLANQNLVRAQLASIPDIMLRGGEGVADIYSKQAQNTLAWASNLPKYNLPAMNYTALRDYGLN